jgi:hypothetical protein
MDGWLARGSCAPLTSRFSGVMINLRLPPLVSRLTQ